MRPVTKGPWPEDPTKPGQPFVFTEYGLAKRFLMERLGTYCSYCEQRIPANLAVEHVQPKSLKPALALSWNNFLLGCVNCNSNKGNKPVVLSKYVWPDLNNTLKYFTYDFSGIVKPNQALNTAEKGKAQKLITLVGLHKMSPAPGTIDYYNASDLRHENRIKSWLLATRYETAYSNAAPEIKVLMLEFLVTIVDRDGF